MMTPDMLVAYVEGLAGHAVLAGIVFLLIMMLKDYATAIVKSLRWRSAMKLKEGDRVMLDNHPAIVTAINLTAVTFCLYNGGMKMRTVSIERAAYIKVERIVVPEGELHGRGGGNHGEK